MSAINPDDTDIALAWEKWQQALTYGYPIAAREWREMYFTLLDRRDAQTVSPDAAAG